MLVRRKRLAVPRHVGNIHQQIRLRQLARDLAAEGIFVADVHCDFCAGHVHRLRGRGALGETGERNIQPAVHPGEQRWDEFAECDQVRFVVALLRRCAQRNGAVEIAVRCARGGGFARRTLCNWCANDEIGTARRGLYAQAIEIILRHRIEECGQRSLRHHH